MTEDQLIQAVLDATAAYRLAVQAANAEQPKMDAAEGDLTAKRNYFYQVEQDPSSLIAPIKASFLAAQQTRDSEFTKMSDLQTRLYAAKAALAAAVANLHSSSGGAELTS